mgnify:FL=1
MNGVSPQVIHTRMTQDQALSILKTGANVFLTGEPGSGKTHTINRYVAYLRERGIEPAITASTGIAATHIGGMTIHSWGGIGIKTMLDKRELDKFASNKYVAPRIRRAKVLILDEVSMLAPETLSMVDAVCRSVRHSMEPFGGMQVVLVGDFFQLPPVIKMEPKESAQTELIETPKARFAYDSSAWTRADLATCYLTEQYRQDDDTFLSILLAIRCGVFNEDHMRLLETRKVEHHTVSKNITRIFSHNADVDRVNNEMLSKLQDEPQMFFMTKKGPEALVAALQKGCLSPETLHLKVGAAVIFTKNNPKKGFVNGTLGEIEKFDKTSGYPIVKTRNGKRIEVEPADWTVQENGKERVRITQLPLRLAWAITVHKSQGMSLDEAVMDLSLVFEFGQGYVALSRLRRLSGLHLLGYNERAFSVHPEILVKDESFRKESEEIGVNFADMPPAELDKKYQHFIVACGGKNISERLESNKVFKDSQNGSGTPFEKIRETHPNAYRSWDMAQDEKLRELFTERISISELEKIFERKKGAISSRLKKLGLTP